MNFWANGMTWVLRKTQMQLFSYQKWLEWSSRTVFAQFVVPEPKLEERTRNELNMSFGSNGMTWVLRKTQLQLFSYQKWLELSSRTVLAWFVVTEPKLRERTRNELNMSSGANGMTWVLRKTQMQLFSYQKWLEQSSRTVFAQFVIPEPKLQEQTRNELNMNFWANGMTWVLRKTQMQLFSYQKWLEWSSRTIFAQFVVPEPKLQERTRNELNMSFGANGMTWVLRKIQMQLFSYQMWLELSSGTVFAQFVVPEPNLQERTRNELNMSFGANGMTWVLRKIQMQLFLYQMWLELSSGTVFAQFVVPEPNLQERTRNELNMSFEANGMTWVLRKFKCNSFRAQCG